MALVTLINIQTKHGGEWVEGERRAGKEFTEKKLILIILTLLSVFFSPSLLFPPAFLLSFFLSPLSSFSCIFIPSFLLLLPSHSVLSACPQVFLEACMAFPPC